MLIDFSEGVFVSLMYLGYVYFDGDWLMENIVELGIFKLDEFKSVCKILEFVQDELEFKLLCGFLLFEICFQV